MVREAGQTRLNDEDRIGKSDIAVSELTRPHVLIHLLVPMDQVLRALYYRIAMPDQDRIPVCLSKGINTLLIKSGHGGEAWKLSLRLTDASGEPVTDGVSIGLP